MLPRSCRARGNVNGDKRPSFVDGDLDLVPLFLHLRYVVVCSGCRVRRVSMSGCRLAMEAQKVQRGPKQAGNKIL